MHSWSITACVVLLLDLWLEMFLYAYILVDVMPQPQSPYLSSVSLQRYHMNWCPMPQRNHVVAHDLHSAPFEGYHDLGTEYLSQILILCCVVILCW